ncbi:MAG: PleD family two-component system response regulator, partial [Candidatus Zixiibacteriota bacterium]
MQEWKIVIVDKDQAVLELLKTIFEEKGYKVTTVSSSQEAVQVIESLMPHLIILEIDLPGMDGYEICKKIKADSKTRLIPVMFLTEKREMEDKIKGLRLGAIDYLTKPFQREELLARVHNVLHTCGALIQPPQKELKEEDVFSKLSSIS